MNADGANPVNVSNNAASDQAWSCGRPCPGAPRPWTSTSEEAPAGGHGRDRLDDECR